jgi:CDP-glycerol glycerophosphotransferase (TagB/SpsB family)
LIAALAAHPDWHLVIRPHPSDVYALPPASAQLTLSTRADDLHTLLAASDAVVTMTSTVGLEAALLGVPLVTWDASENTPYCPYASMGLARGVTDFAALAPALVEALAGRGPRAELPPVGAATRLISARVREILQLARATNA